MTKINLSEIFNSFNEKNVLIIGDVMIDSYIWGNVRRISPEAPVPIVEVTKRENRLGGAANVAMNLKALGANPVLCSVIGEDDKAELFINIISNQKQMTSEGICF
jgi:D-glycero-beta-D-manno-heptose-7-phosphate kinase